MDWFVPWSDAGGFRRVCRSGGGRKAIRVMNYFLSGWTWIAAKRTTGCPTTLSVRRLFRHNCLIGLLENIIFKQSKFIFIYGSHCFQNTVLLRTHFFEAMHAWSVEVMFSIMKFIGKEAVASLMSVVLEILGKYWNFGFIYFEFFEIMENIAKLPVIICKVKGNQRATPIQTCIK